MEGKNEGLLHLNGFLRNKQNVIPKKMEKIVIPYTDKIKNFIKNKIKIQLGNRLETNKKDKNK